MPYDETFLPFAGRKIREEAKLEEGTRAFINPKDFKKRSNKSSTSMKVGEEEEYVCSYCGTAFNGKDEYDEHMKTEHDDKDLGHGPGGKLHTGMGYNVSTGQTEEMWPLTKRR